MKIALFHNLPPGGAKRTVYEQAKYLSRSHELHLFQLSGTDENYLSLYPFVKSVKTYPFSLSLNRLLSDFQKFVVLPQVHRKMAQDIDADVALIHADHYTQAPYILRYLKIPSLYFCQEMLRIAYESELAFTEPVGFFKRWYESATRCIRKQIDKNNIGSAAQILTNSNFTRQKIQLAVNRPATVSHPGVDPRIFKPVSKSREKQILFVDQKDKITGYDLVLAALNLIPPKLRPELKVLGFSQGSPAVSHQNVVRSYSSSLTTICASYNEPFGLPPIESMACATPVLAVNEGGYRETVVDGITGWLLPRDPQAFAAKIVYLQKHPEIVKKMGLASRKHIIKNFTWDRHVNHLEKILYKLAKIH